MLCHYRGVHSRRDETRRAAQPPGMGCRRLGKHWLFVGVRLRPMRYSHSRISMHPGGHTATNDAGCILSALAIGSTGEFE